MKQLKNQTGFTLIEIIVGLAILAIIVLPITALLTSGFSGVFRAGRKTVALYEVQRQLENAIERGTDSTADSLSITFPVVAQPVVVNGKILTVQQPYEDREVSVTTFIPKR